MLDIRTKKVNENAAVPRMHFVIKPREPWELPDKVVEIPSPPRLPSAPAPLNLLSMILPPVMMLVIYAVIMLVMAASVEEGTTSSSINPLFLIMPLAGMGMPVASFFTHKNQTKKYHEDLQIREQNYRHTLAETRIKLDALAKQQKDALEREYPLLPRLVSIGLGISHQKRLWWRRRADPDFLSLWMGTGSGKASFSVMPPRVLDPEDPLTPFAVEVSQAYQEIQHIPLLLDMLKIGSVALADQGGDSVYSLARRLVLDIIVHHSPQDVQIVVLADTQQSQDRWEWLKWAPHTHALIQGETNRRLAFNATAIDKSVEWLMSEFEGRRKSEPGVRKRQTNQASIVVLLDDSGDIRRTEDIRQLTESGLDANIYLVFVGGRNWPRECRARVEVSKNEFKYIETFVGDGKGKRLRGEIDPASLIDCERVARALAGLEISSGGGSSNLPESVRLWDILDPKEPSLEGLKKNWTRVRGDDELLQFPFGLRNGRKGVEPVVLNLLPPEPEYLGIGAYHTILVGTTGSGKSEFMKSLVLSAAYKYSPHLLNFFFMDFKGGAAFNLLKDLPHVVGVVTNLSPQLVERGLSALEAEFARRQKFFADAAVSNIWAYNTKYPESPIPHLMLLLDEFARGLNDFPRLPDMLDKLVRQGRSLGVYLLLANQDVNSAVDRLLNNVGWHIALKVARQEEMYVIDRSLPKVERTGQGYLHSQDGDVYEFQAAYSGFSVTDQEEKVEESFRIYQVGSDGKWNSIYTNMRRPSAAEKERNRSKEQDQLISMMKDLSDEVEPARPIYLEPLETIITLEHVLGESGIPRTFMAGKWVLKSGRNRLVVPIGYTDSTEECIQECLQVDFDDQDGHLWLIGGPASGKAMTIESTLLSLALTNTPEEVQFYILEFGAAGRLRHFQSLSHCGVVITPKDPVEMLDRLLRFIDEEMSQRTNRKNKDKKRESREPEIFLVINNFGEFRTAFPDHADRIASYINGKAMGVHLIIATNRRMELPSKLVIARKVVLRLANRDEYSDAIGGRVAMLPALQAEGRGLWVDGKPLECQIAQPTVAMDANGELLDAEEVCQVLTKKWRGKKAAPIRVLPTQIPLTDLYEQTVALKHEDTLIPVGLSFETTELVTANLFTEIPRWLILGPPRSGKSNFLACLANTVLARHGTQWDIVYFSLRRPMPDSIDKSSVRLSSTPTEAIQIINEIIQKFDQPSINSKRVLFLIDDLGAAFEPGRDTLTGALNNLALKASTREDVFIVGTGIPDELRLHQMTSQLVRSLKQSRMGIAFSKESGDLELLSTQIPLHYRRMELPPGRGFWVNGGKAVLVQTPRAENLRPE